MTSLLDKLADREFLRYVQLFDIVCLGETFLDYLNAETFPVIQSTSCLLNQRLSSVTREGDQGV